jgi:hypothetical protein
MCSCFSFQHVRLQALHSTDRYPDTVLHLDSYHAGFAIVTLVVTESSMTSTSDGLAATVALFMTYSSCNAAFTYCLSFLFSSASGAQRAMIFLNAVCICLVILSFIVGRSSETCGIDADFNYFFRIFPHYAWGNGLLKVRL